MRKFMSMQRLMKERMADCIIEMELAPAEVVRECLSKTDESNGIIFEDLLLKNEVLSAKDILRVKSIVTQIESYDVKKMEFAPELLALIPKDKAINNCCLPMGFDESYKDMLLVVVDNPEDEIVIGDISLMTGYAIRPYAGLRRDILARIDEVYAE